MLMKINGPVLNYTNFLHWVEHESLINYGYPESLSKYIPLNLKRMHRLDKTLKLDATLYDLLANNPTEQIWYVITEAWCGDSAQNLPVIARMAELSKSQIQLRIMLRDINPEIMNQHLTDGSRSIPKLVSFDVSSGEKLFEWGPRPVPAQALLHQWKLNPQGKSWDEFELELHTWYARDKARTIQQEFIALLCQSELATSTSGRCVES